MAPVPVRLRSAVVAALLAVTAAVSSPVAAQVPAPVPTAGPGVAPGLGIALLEAPEVRRDDPRARSAIVDHVAPGATFTRRIRATNGTDEPAAVEFYARPATVQRGSFRLQEDPQGYLAQVVSVSPATATVPPGGVVEAVATFTVPADTVEGEYYGAVLVAKPPPPGSGLQLASRAGIPVYLSVGPGGEPASDFVVESLRASRDAAGVPVVEAQVRNTGGRALNLSGELALSEGPGSSSAGPFSAELGTVLGVDQTAPVRVELAPGLPDGPWTATLTLRSGQLERSAQGRITFPEQAGEQADEVRAEPLGLAEDPKVVIPFAIGLIAVLALLLLVVGYLASRRRARARLAG